MNTAIRQLLSDLQDSAIEKFAVIYHGRDGIIGAEIIAEGDAEHVVLSTAAVFDGIKKHGANMISLVHNHPSGPVRPGQTDLATTFEIQDRLKRAGLKLHDHVIVGREGSPYSFLNNGVI